MTLPSQSQVAVPRDQEMTIFAHHQICETSGSAGLSCENNKEIEETGETKRRVK